MLFYGYLYHWKLSQWLFVSDQALTAYKTREIQKPIDDQVIWINLLLD